VFTLNLLAAAPPTPEIGAAIPVGGPLGVGGSIAMLAILGGTLAILRGEARTPQEQPVLTPAFTT
jgi:hypothetical protein